MGETQAKQKIMQEISNYSGHEGEEGKGYWDKVTEKFQAGHKEPGMEDTVTRMWAGPLGAWIDSK